MSTTTDIAWTDHTFNPWWGCERVSPGCTNCYAEAFARRTGHDIWGGTSPRRFFGDKHWREPLKWNADAERAGVRRRVFCASMADVFEDRPDLDEPRGTLFEVIAQTPSLDWQLLTKRPQNVARMVPWGDEGTHRAAVECWQNVWIGTTVEDQQRAALRIPILQQTAAAVRFLSVEPLLGPVRLQLDGIGWVILGGESGPKRRPFDPAWAEDVARQCDAAGVPLFVKQDGGLYPGKQGRLSDELWARKEFP